MTQTKTTTKEKMNSSLRQSLNNKYQEKEISSDTHNNKTPTKEKKIIDATKHHLNNIKILSKRKPSEEELKEMYSYLDTCFLCGEPITFWNRLSFNCQHSFCGNSHRRCPNGK